MQEELLASLESKNPSVKEETVRFLTRCFCKSTPSALPKTFLKPVCSSLLKVIHYETEPFITFVVFTSDTATTEDICASIKLESFMQGQRFFPDTCAFLFFYCKVAPSLAIMVLIQVPFFVSISNGTMTSNTLAVNKMNFKRLCLICLTMMVMFIICLMMVTMSLFERWIALSTG